MTYSCRCSINSEASNCPTVVAPSNNRPLLPLPPVASGLSVSTNVLNGTKNSQEEAKATARATAKL